MKGRKLPHEVEFLKLSAGQRGAWINLLLVHREVVRQLDWALSERHGLSLAEWDALVHLPEEPGVRMSDLAGALLLSPSGLTRMMERLEGRGLVERRRGEEDARETYVSLTRKGRDLLAEAAPTHNEELKAHLLQALSSEEANTLAALLGKVAAAPSACPRHPS